MEMLMESSHFSCFGYGKKPRGILLINIFVYITVPRQHLNMAGLISHGCRISVDKDRPVCRGDNERRALFAQCCGQSCYGALLVIGLAYNAPAVAIHRELMDNPVFGADEEHVFSL